MIGPKTTPYEKGLFIMFVNFPDNYPEEPPIIRFTTYIYHCNVNSHGRICHSILERNYLVDVKMKDIFNCIFGLLLTPEVENPLDNTVAS